MFKAVRKSALIIAKFVVLCCAFCKLRRNFGFFCSINHHSGPLRKHMFTCDWCISIHFVCFCFSSSLLVIALFQAIIDQFSSKIFLMFLILTSLLQEQSNVCLLPSTKSPLIIAISFAILEPPTFILSFVLAGQAGRVRCRS